MTPARQQDDPRGVLSAIVAFFLWGVLPLFWKALDFLPAPSIIAHRTLWSLGLLIPVLAFRGRLAIVRQALSTPAGIGWHLLSGSLLASNWLLYVWATLHHHVLDAALGYYLNPFLNMLFGALFFGERQTRWQLVAVIFAAVGVGLQIFFKGGVPWIAGVLALTFALYAVVRKKAPTAALEGLTCETLLLAPLGLAWLTYSHGQGAAVFGGSWPHALLLIATGFATATPLLCFGHATRTIRLTTLGILQFLGPTLQFLIGWGLLHEPMTFTQLLSFGFIWTAIALYAADALWLRRAREESATVPPAR